MANVNYIEKDVVTPIGTALFCMVNTKYDDHEGQRKYVAKMYFENEADEKFMKAMFDKWYEDAKALPENKDKKWRAEPRLYYDFYEKIGKYLFTFKTNAFRTVDGADVKNKVPVFDVHGKQYPVTTTIGNGSLIQVQFDSSWYHKSKDGNGLSIFLKQILVRDLVEVGGNKSAFEFKAAPQGNTNNIEDEIPF